MSTTTVEGRDVELTNPDKLLWDDAGVTKQDLFAAVIRLVERQLPHVAGRPATLVRCPDGIGQQCWFQKDVGDGLPAWVRTAVLEGWEDSGAAHPVVDDAPTAGLLAQLAAVELHVGPCPVDDLDHPAEVVLDLDPPERDDTAARAATRRVGALLEDELGLSTGVKTTGSKGFHVHVPLDGSADVDTVRGFARDAAELLARRHPDELTTEQRKQRRRGRVFVDWLRNHPTQTAVAPYSPRRLPGAPMAVPLSWDELSSGVAPDQHSLSSVFRRLGQREGPWAALRSRAQPLGDAVARLAELG